VNENEENAVDISGDTLAGARVTVTIIDSANNRVGPVRVTADSLGNWVVEDVDLGGLVDGPLTIVAVAVDSVGNRADASRPILKDTVAQDLSIDSPITADNIVNDA